MEEDAEDEEEAAVIVVDVMEVVDVRSVCVCMMMMDPRPDSSFIFFLYFQCFLMVCVNTGPCNKPLP